MEGVEAWLQGCGGVYLAHIDRVLESDVLEEVEEALQGVVVLGRAVLSWGGGARGREHWPGELKNWLRENLSMKNRRRKKYCHG